MSAGDIAYVAALSLGLIVCGAIGLFYGLKDRCAGKRTSRIREGALSAEKTPSAPPAGYTIVPPRDGGISRAKDPAGWARAALDSTAPTSLAAALEASAQRRGVDLDEVAPRPRPQALVESEARTRLMLALALAEAQELDNAARKRDVAS